MWSPKLKFQTCIYCFCTCYKRFVIDSRFKSTLGLMLICCLCIYIPTLNRIYLILTYLLNLLHRVIGLYTVKIDNSVKEINRSFVTQCTVIICGVLNHHSVRTDENLDKANLISIPIKFVMSLLENINYLRHWKRLVWKQGKITPIEIECSPWKLSVFQIYIIFLFENDLSAKNIYMVDTRTRRT